MNEINVNYATKETLGRLKYKAKEKASYYKKNGYAPTIYLIGCHPKICEKDIRYINFMDENNLIKSRNKYSYAALTHKRPTGYLGYPKGFDHTTEWRRKGDRFPLFILTEPYQLPKDEEIKKWDWICERYDLKYQIFDKSEKSLWVPNSTYMIFWWCPKFWELEEKLMEHIDWSKLKKNIEKIEFKRPIARQIKAS